MQSDQQHDSQAGSQKSRVAYDNPKHWKRVAGIPRYKLEWHAKRLLYKLFGIKLPKLADQRDYWEYRGQAYFDEITASGYLEREQFFQDLLVRELADLDFSSFFEVGCGFGWNIVRVKEEFSQVRSLGVDFSSSQLASAGQYMAAKNLHLPLLRGDACSLPFKDNAIDVGFTLGVFMNIHPKKIRSALGELLRVCGKRIIHLEYDESRTTPELREKRAFKTNIISHDYVALYEELGAEVLKVLTYEDFGDAFHRHARRVTSSLERWEGFEGPEKYMLIVIRPSKDFQKDT